MARHSLLWRHWSGIFTGSLLLLATAAFTLWQNSRVAVLWDLSYLLDTSYRIAIGKVPYRSFPLVHPPLTFLIQALLIRIFGRVYFIHIGYAALVSGFGTVLSWRIILHALRGRIAPAPIVSLLLTAPLIALGIYGVYPHPIYDCDCAFAILVAVFLLQRLNSASVSWLRSAATGIAVVFPVFFKQNIGLPFLLTVVTAVLALLAAGMLRKQTSQSREQSRILLQVLVCMVAALLLALAVIHSTVGLGNYLQWTVQFAASRRLPGFREMLTVYQQPSFLWTLPTFGLGLLLLSLPIAKRRWIGIAALCLAVTPFLASLIFLFYNDDADERADNLLALWPLLLLTSAVVSLVVLRKGLTLPRLIPFFVLAAIHGAFLSQQLWGSTYALWPFLMILIAYLLASLPIQIHWRVLALASSISLPLLVCGAFYATSLERLNYLQIPDEPADSTQHATLPALRGMADRGPYLIDFEELISFTNQTIPAQEGILLLPGEEPFFYATGRTPQFPVQIFDRTTDPYSPEQLLAEARKRNIRWVIVKTRLQSSEDPLPVRAQTIVLMDKEFRTRIKLAGYDVYSRTHGE